MPLNANGTKIKAAMEKQYGKDQGDRVFYASEHKGTIHGVTKTGGESEHVVHHMHQPGSVVHHIHHYGDGANVVHHHMTNSGAQASHMTYPEGEECPLDNTSAAENTSSVAEREANAAKGLKEAFPKD
jgi:hypothetical protein